MGLKNKRVLITAGPTWVPIDRVRVISNIATGETGLLLAQRLRDLGADVTLVLGPVSACCVDSKIRLLRFKFFDELKDLITRELKSRKYDIVIHSAAVSDYRPVRYYADKIKSGRKRWRLDLIPTTKIIDSIKKIRPSLYLVGFKFEPGLAKNTLIKEARGLMLRANLDATIANSITKNRYLAYILEPGQIYGPMLGKKHLVRKLVNMIRERI